MVSQNNMHLAVEKMTAVDRVMGSFLCNAASEVTNVSELVNIARAVTKAHDEFLEAEGLATGENA